MPSRPRTLIIGAACLVAAAPSSAQVLRMAPEEFQVNQHEGGIQQSASVALDAGGNAVVAWQSEVPGHGDEIRARRFDACGAPRSDEIAVNAVSAGQQDAPAIAMTPEGSFMVAWQTIVQSNLEVRARRFDSSGRATGGEIAVNTRTGNANSDPAVAIDALGNFVVAWESTIAGSYEIRARRFDARGTALSAELAVNADIASSQRAPALAMAADGAFIVAWRSNLDGSLEIRARRFDPSGTPASDELPVNTTRVGDQVAPSVAIAHDGTFVVAWENSFDNNYDIRARRFDAHGAATTDEFAIQPGTGGQQFAPALAMAKDGNFLIAWQTFKAGHLDLHARSFSANATPLSEAIALNSITTGNQKGPTLAMNATGAVAAAWHSDTPGNWDIAARTGTLHRGRAKNRSVCAKAPAAPSSR
jgi:hypothetical protein